MYKTEIQRSKSVAEKAQNDAKGCKMFKGCQKWKVLKGSFHFHLLGELENLDFEFKFLASWFSEVDIFRDALIDLFEMEMNDQSLTPQGRHVMALLINYVGGALIFIRREYQSRIELIHSTWHVAKLGVQGVVEEEEKQEQETTRQSTSSSRRRSIWKQEQETARHGASSGRRRSSHSHSQKKHEEEADNTPISNEATETRPSKFDNVEDVPTNFAESWRHQEQDLLLPECTW